jgi:hypothetical protein
MAIFRSATELRRWNDIGVIRDVLESKFAGCGANPIDSGRLRSFAAAMPGPILVVIGTIGVISS